MIQVLLNARAPSTRALYANRWRLFCNWCESQHVDPITCSVPILLHYVNTLMDKGLTASTMKVSIYAISARHVPVDGRSVGSHPLVSRYLRGVLRLHPPHAVRVPSWDLPLVLEALCAPPFEPMEQTDLRWLSVKTAFLLAVTSAKRVGELHALSIAKDCLRWASDGSGVTMWPNPSFLPKRISAFHINQPLTLTAYAPRSGVDVRLCPMRALRRYIKVTAKIRKSDALFLCYGGQKRGLALSKQRLAHWIVEAILQAYKWKGRPAPQVKCHSTRGVSTSWAVLKGVPLTDICKSASWASSCTFARFYRVNVAAPQLVQTAVLSASSTGN